MSGTQAPSCSSARHPHPPWLLCSRLGAARRLVPVCHCLVRCCPCLRRRLLRKPSNSARISQVFSHGSQFGVDELKMGDLVVNTIEKVLNLTQRNKDKEPLHYDLEIKRTLWRQRKQAREQRIEEDSEVEIEEIEFDMAENNNDVSHNALNAQLVRWTLGSFTTTNPRYCGSSIVMEGDHRSRIYQ
ncbi:uncharacterized protein LOC107639259 isoform X2 [Arachis ipaensis]|uniref:uncharacterized protein LOC107639259 isoform X2 n=1 Tax=Arachis ipaensis TaxID=130454 RepID=UPI0007AF5671|nr:uncharacterized protein LOC107639259 isoform X2 [Arachis ipaensis]XP_025646988.1 uncharacterized protein LOC112741993 isoform X2 [Arachis hypogaea]